MDITIELENNAAPHNQSGVNRYGGVFKSKRELAYIKDLASKINELYDVEQFTDTPLSVTYRFGIKPPKSWSKKKTQQALANEIYPTGKNIGDIDNLVKSTQDVLMNTGIIDDDSNVVSLLASKEYSDYPYIHIRIEKV
ncbi:RusA family crossover junction endodeoxyribonuclease [Leuconostoc mesenteroides]